MQLSSRNILLLTSLVFGAAARGQSQDCLKSLTENFSYEGGFRRTDLPLNPACITGESKVDWISVTVVPPGTIAGSLRYFVKPNLKPATRKGEISIGGQTLTVSQERAPAGGIAGSPSPLQFRAPAGNPEKQKQTQTLKIWGDEEFQYSASVAEPDQKWLQVGTAKAAGGVTEVPVSIDANGLKPNSYTAHISVNAPGASNSPLKVTVNLTVEP